jgi:hypothetical protein
MSRERSRGLLDQSGADLAGGIRILYAKNSLNTKD